MAIEKSKAMTFGGKETVRMKIVLTNRPLEQIWHFHYLGCITTNTTETSSKKLVSIKPVSYTHLDVYKRQKWRLVRTKIRLLIILFNTSIWENNLAKLQTNYIFAKICKNYRHSLVQIPTISIGVIGYIIQLCLFAVSYKKPCFVIGNYVLIYYTRPTLANRL